MSMHSRLISRVLTSAMLVLASTMPALAQPSAFTYQGRLKNGASPAEGLHDFRFKLFDAPTSGTQIGTTQCVDNLLVGGGVFMATLDFGAQFVTSGQRFIEIEVRADTGLNCSNVGGFVVLAPRQPVTPTPTATHAKTAFSLAAADGSPSQAVFVDNAGNVGVGTLAPTSPVHIASDLNCVIQLQDTGPNATQSGYVDFRNSSGVETAWMGFGTPGDPDFSIVNARPAGDIVFNPFSGNVGIGTASPTSKLQVNGDIRLGPVGQYRAPACEENLRIIRGTIDWDGTILRGSGFTAQWVDKAKYTLTFNTPFAAIPTVTATARRTSTAGIDNVVTPSQVTIVMWSDIFGEFDNDRFDFIAIGPR